MSDDFYEEYGGIFGGLSSIDQILSGKKFGSDAFSSVRALTDRARETNALPLPVEAGTRVAFVHNLGSVLTYPDVPDEGVSGTVVVVRSANGDATSYEGRVMVQWDDGKFRPILAEHLKLASLKSKQAQSVRVRFSNLGDITNIFGMVKGGSGSDLVHRATKDLWSFRQDDGGGYVIERLFNEDGNPLKV